MRILYFSQYFPPEVGATQTRAYEMARGLVKDGHQVTMIAEVPNHPKGIIPPEYRGKLYERTTLDGFEVLRVWVKASPVKSFRSRLAFYISYMMMAALAGLFLARGRYDAIYATSPPLFVGGAALAVSWLRRIPLFFEVRDLWPESAVALGELNNPKAIRMAEFLEKSCYQRAKKIIVVTKGIQANLLARGIPAEKITIIPNGANTELFQPKPEQGVALREKLNLQHKFIVAYVGIHGVAQGLEYVLEAAKKLPDYTFIFVGEGPAKAALVQQAEDIQCTNIIFHPEIPREDVPDFLSMANVALVPLRDLDLFKGAIPSKMFDSWACGCPTLITVSGEAQQVLEEAQAGLWVEPENAKAIADALSQMAQDVDLCREWGKNGRKFTIQNYSRQAQAQELVNLLIDAVA